MNEYRKIDGIFEPIFDKDSKILILGSLPSVKSFEIGFYYGNTKNRFWQVLSSLYNQEIGENIKDKKEFLLSHNIALWDSIKSCEVKGSADSSIRNIVANDIMPLIENSKIRKVYTNGKLSQRLYEKYIYKSVKIESINLPSTSPANASYSLERLIDKWKIILDTE